MQAIGHYCTKFSVTITSKSNLIHRSSKVPVLPLRLKSGYCGFFSRWKNRTENLSGNAQDQIQDMSNIACLHGNNTMDAVCSNHGAALSVRLDESKPVLNLNKVVVIGKMTRYEFEKLRFSGFIEEEEFKEVIISRGSDYDALLAQHLKHMKTMSSIREVLNQRGIEFQVCTRGKSYTMDLINWADAIITAGGDGTFLSAASKIRDQNKPVIGINTNPNRSEGHLCLPPKYTTDLGKALDKLANGHFKWLWRHRIRITMKGMADNFRPIHNGDMLQSRMSNNSPMSANEPEFIYRHDLMTDASLQPFQSTRGVSSQVLPVLALNEVFIGESLAAVPSYYEIKIDDETAEQQKSSGLCVCTGTGSTAWSYNICRLPDSAVRRVLELTAQAISSNENPHSSEENGKKSSHYPDVSEDLVKRVTDAYSQSFIYEPDSEQMLFSVRDPMQNRVFKCSQSNGFARKLVVRSRCWDASLCIDGEISFAFNDGAVATLEMLPCDALRTVVLNEDDNCGEIDSGWAP